MVIAKDQICDFRMVHIRFLLIKLPFDLQSHSILPYKGSGNISESAGQKDLHQPWSLSHGTGEILVDPVFFEEQCYRPIGWGMPLTWAHQNTK